MTAPATAAAAPRLPFLDALRGYAILGVIAVHADQVAPLQSPTLASYAQHGRYGVQLFFIVSAVSIAMAWHARADGYDRFLVRRLFRLWPALSLAVAGYTAIGWTQMTWWHTAMTLLFVNGWHPAAIDSVVPGSWTLSSEMMFYLSVPLLAAAIRSPRTAALWIVGAELVALTFSHPVASFWNAVYPAGIGVMNDDYFGMSIFALAKWFILGWTTYIAIKTVSLPQSMCRRVFWAAAACLLAAPVTPSSTLRDLAFMFALPAIVFAMSRGVAPLLDNAVLRWLGTISYGMYLWHFVVYKAASAYLREPTFLTVFACTLVITAACASVTYVLIERPGINLGGLVIRRWRERAAAAGDADVSRRNVSQP